VDTTTAARRRPRPGFRAILFDIDGTLLRPARRREYRDMMCRMLVDIFGTEGKLREVDFSGRTDLAIYREALEPAGMDGNQIRRNLPRLEEASVDIIRRMSSSGEVFKLCAGVRELLEALSRDDRFVSTLLTGNFESLALSKLHAAGIGRYFNVRGAYGSDAEDRNQLPAIAAQRLIEQFGEPLAPERMTIVGDTPRDIACARHYGARVLAVASGYHSVDQLRAFQPDALLPDLSNTCEVLKVLAAD
jgi:phosphoglycolate phosphatase-like HAD superfamily hydrolase